MTRRPRLFPILITLLSLFVLTSHVQVSASTDDPFQAADRVYQETVRPLLQKYCHGCHGAQQKKAGLDLEAVADARAVASDRDRWELVAGFTRDGEMPPAGKHPRPSMEEIETIASWIESTLTSVDCDLTNPGSVTLRRLNRTEYNNTIRDLLGVDFLPANDFPADDVGYGFDNIGDVLTLDPLLMEKYLSAAEEIARRAIDTAGPAVIPSKVYRDGSLRRAGGERHENGRILTTEGEIGIDHAFPFPGRYLIRIRAFGDQAGDEPVRMAVKLDGKVVEEIRVEAERRPRRYEVVVRTEAGTKRVAAAFLNDFYDEKADPARRDRNLIIDEFQILGPGDPLNTIELEELDDASGGARAGQGRVLASSGQIQVNHKADARGEYRIQVRAYGDQAGTEPVKMNVRVDGRPIQTFDVEADASDPRLFEVRLPLDPGDHRITLAFLNDYYDPDNPNPDLRGDRNLYVDRVTIVGPIEGYYQRVPAAHRLLFAEPIFTTNEAEALRAAIRRLTTRAFRRPPTDDEVNGLAQLASLVRDDGGSPEEALRLVLEAVLVSPSFLYRAEYGAPSSSDQSPGVQPIGDYELASRLSYFLWSSLPDDELLRAAGAGELRSPDALESQARRMLTDPRARSLVDNFAAQWLQIRLLDQVNPDPNTFPRFGDRLRSAMRTETLLFVESVFREDRSILDLLDTNYTFLNETLARHYGISGVRGDEFRRVELKPEDHRGGLLTHASILTVTSNPTRTSPVKRGKWVLEQILGTPPPPPPPDVPPLPEDGPAIKGTLRQRLELHRSNAGCASCHERMDPIGFGLENYDAIGAWREKDGSDPIDPSGSFTDGQTFDGPTALRNALRSRSTDFARCVAEKLMTYALGRGLEYYDRCAVDKMLAALQADDYRFSRLVAEVVRSDPFRFRQVEGSE